MSMPRAWSRMGRRLIVLVLALGLVAAGGVPAYAATVPTAPTTVAAVPGNGYVTGTWRAPTSNGGSSITSYVVAVRSYVARTKTWTAWKSSKVAASARSKRFPYPNGTSVQVKVRAGNARGLGAWSAVASTKAGLPSAVPGTKATAGDGFVTVAWSAAAGNGSSISAYRLFRRQLVGSTWSAWSAATQVSAGTRSRKVTGLTKGTTYQFRLAAVNRYGQGPFGAIVSAIPKDAVAPGSVTGLAAGTRTSNSIPLSWSLPADADLAAVVVRRASGEVPPSTPASGALVATSPALATSAADSGLSAGTAYSYSVFVRDTSGNWSAPATLTTATLAAVGLQGVSTASDGSFGYGYGGSGVLSPDGTKVAFVTTAPLDPVLDPSTSFPAYDIYIKDLATGVATLVTRKADGSANGGGDGISWSPDSSKIAFQGAYGLTASDWDGSNIHVYDLATGSITQILRTWDGKQPNGYVYDGPVWSPDGEWLAFSTAASNMTTTPDFNSASDVFAIRLSGGLNSVLLISKNSVDGAIGNGSSGGMLAYAPTTPLRLMYATTASNIVGSGPALVVTEQASGASVRVDDTLLGPANGQVWEAQWSPDGERIAYVSSSTNVGLNDTNGATDVFVTVPGDRDPIRVSQASTTEVGDAESWQVTWSGDSSAIAFATYATNLSTDSSARLKIVISTSFGSKPRLVSSAADGTPSNGSSNYAAVNHDGSVVAFSTSGNNLVPGVDVGQQVYAKNTVTGAVELVSKSAAGVPGNDYSGSTANSMRMKFSPTGGLMFQSAATNLLPGISGAGGGFVREIYFWRPSA